MSTTTNSTVDKRLLYTVIGVAVLAKSADVLTTAYWLQQPGARELNPVVVAAYRALGAGAGITAMLALSGLVIAGVELTARLVSRQWSGWSPWYRLGSYASLAVLWIGAGLHNMVIIT